MQLAEHAILKNMKANSINLISAILPPSTVRLKLKLCKTAKLYKLFELTSIVNTDALQQEGPGFKSWAWRLTCSPCA